ncbi:hypothetical protein SAMN05216551_102236 [Chitinasiproducens palmae]|uniref:Uncharacterized protein n=1 Tax=Chitinasiproducens palmae TaxID=1770053 RepID=A0A1H2PMT1_9BURK|nr:hypothetical protein SAMN05216551_102236 [Chitinasiproducens palmae]
MTCVLPACCVSFRLQRSKDSRCLRCLERSVPAVPCCSPASETIFGATVSSLSSFGRSRRNGCCSGLAQEPGSVGMRARASAGSAEEGITRRESRDMVRLLSDADRRGHRPARRNGRSPVLTGRRKRWSPTGAMAGVACRRWPRKESCRPSVDVGRVMDRFGPIGPASGLLAATALAMDRNRPAGVTEIAAPASGPPCCNVT